ncbi:hypothetical protein, partial [Paraburkholderia caledonica]|uniref:hypothetical protein n=1 Tax=Paraburkholderia caledonica TaxID=134536 RepID=UPI003CA091FE
MRALRRLLALQSMALQSIHLANAGNEVSVARFRRTRPRVPHLFVVGAFALSANMVFAATPEFAAVTKDHQ